MATSPKQPDEARSNDKLSSLPNELLDMIATYIDDPITLYSLSIGCKHLSCLMAPYLHQFATRNHGDMTALQWAARRGHAGLAKIVLQSGANTNDSLPSSGRTMTSLHYAIKSGNVALVKLLIDHGANVDAQNGAGDTPVHIAVNTWIACEMFSQTPDFRCRLKSSRSRNLSAIMRVLLQFHPSLSIKNDCGRTALHQATVYRGCGEEAMAMLLEHGAPVNTVANNGQTPLQMAMAIKSEEKMRLLIRYGSDVGILRHPSGRDWDLEHGISKVLRKELSKTSFYSGYKR